MNQMIAELERLAALPPEERAESSVRQLARQLPPDGERCLRLAAIPHDFTVSLLLALDASLSAARVEAACERLLRLGLAIEVGGVLRFRDSVRRIFFGDWLHEVRSEEFRSLSRTLAAEFRRAAAESDGAAAVRVVFHEIGADQDAGFAQFEALFDAMRARFQLSACAGLLAMVHEYDPVLAPAHAARLAYAEGRLASDRCQWDEAEARFTAVLEHESVPDDLRVQTLLHLGTAYLKGGRHQQAVRAYSRARELAAATPNVIDDAQSLHWLATAYRESGDYEKALRLLRECIEMASTAGDPIRLAQAYNALGLVYLRQREVDDALKAFEESLRRLKSQDLESPQLLLNLGCAYADLPDLGRSREYLERGLALNRERGDAGGEAMTLNNLARIYENAGRHGDAIQAVGDAVALFERAHDFRSAGEAARNLARLHLRARLHPNGAAPASAASAFARAIELFRRAGAADAAAASEHELAQIGRRQSVPWWAWATIGIGAVVLVVLLFWLAL